MITNKHKQEVVTRLAEKRPLFSGSDTAFARSIGLHPSQYSRIKKGDFDNVISDSSWLTLARKYNVMINGTGRWVTAHTDVYEYITTQLNTCQEQSIAGLMCDLAGIGKSYTAKIYAETHKNVVYVDCSQTKTKRRLVKYIAKQFGVSGTGVYEDIYEDLVYYLRTIQTPLIILDEMGDLKYEAFLEIKALWNATEHCCGWYMMGADGLKKKIETGRDNSKVGFAEIFDRYGYKYQRASPLGGEELQHYIRRQSALIIKANAPEGADMQRLLTATDGSLRRIYIEVQKLRHQESNVAE